MIRGARGALGRRGGAGRLSATAPMPATCGARPAVAGSSAAGLFASGRAGAMTAPAALSESPINDRGAAAGDAAADWAPDAASDGPAEEATATAAGAAVAGADRRSCERWTSVVM